MIDDLSTPPHSHAYLSDHRLEWWHKDYIQLLLQRANVHQPQTIADFGIGAGHWALTLTESISSSFTLFGIDQEATWLEAASALLADQANVQQFIPIHSDVISVPLEDNSMDVVTCQTVLMHCSDPQTVAQEMVRVLKPGGALIIIEPYNIFNRTLIFEMARQGFTEESIDMLRFWGHYHRYLRDTRHNDHDIGLRLIEIFSKTQATALQIYHNDAVVISTPTEQPSFSLEEFEYESLQVRTAFSGIEQNKLYQKGIAAFQRFAQIYASFPEKRVAAENMFVLLASK